MELQQLTICSCRTAFPLFGLHMASPLLRNPISSKSAAEQGVRTTMATPQIYKHLQVKLSRFHLGFTVLNMVCVLIAVACLLSAPKESATLSIEALGFIFSGVASGVMMVLSMISSYQQESRITSIPVVGRAYKALIPKPTPWGEAFHINCMVLVCALMVVFLIVFASRF